MPTVELSTVESTSGWTDEAQALLSRQLPDGLCERLINSAHSAIAILDEDGDIVACNSSWLRFGHENGYEDCEATLGMNYLDICREACAAGDIDAINITISLHGLLKGDLEHCLHEYPCHSPNQKRWFEVRVDSCQCSGQRWFMVTHSNITDKKIAQHNLHCTHSRLKRINRELKAANERLYWDATIDSLTGLVNRTAFSQILVKEVAHSRNSPRPLALLMCDVDHFKQFNDTAGHPAGDHCLRQLGQIFRRVARHRNYIAARYGGEEFVILCPGLTSKSLPRFCNHLINNIRAAAIPHPASPIGTAVTCSIGAASMLRRTCCDADELVQSADLALYEAKRCGRNCFRVDSDLSQQVRS